MNLKTINLIGLAWLIICGTLGAQESLTLSNSDNINTPPSGELNRTHYEAVNLLPGYDYNAGPGFKMNAFIDPTIVTPVNYNSMMSQTEFNAYTIDPSLPVGFTPGIAGVSPSGAATYDIPIQLPSGTNGMVPTLSVSYNNQNGNGILGIGWNLSGISAISRVPKTYYHDGKPDKIQFNSTDRLALDGNRIVDTGGGIYKTESETFSEITIHGSENDGTQWFKVKTKDGMTVEYGKTPDSQYKVYPDLNTLHWYINKIYDQHGNYIEYLYITSEQEIRIDKIRYTGNFNLATNAINLYPYNEVQFYYQYREDKSEGYISENLIKSNQLLSKIKVKSHEIQYRQYEFQYALGELFSQLTSVKEYGSNNNESLNATIFNYNTNNQTVAVNSFWPSAGLSSCGNFPNSPNNIGTVFYPGDFNGDGITDLLGLTYSSITVNSSECSDLVAHYTSWAIFINDKHNPNSDDWICYQLPFHPGWFGNVEGDAYGSPYDGTAYFPLTRISFHIGDIDGNGMDDIIVGVAAPPKNCGNFGDYAIYRAFNTSIINSSLVFGHNDLANLEFDDYWENPNWICFWCAKKLFTHRVTLGDFDGDGRLELFGINMRTMNYKISSFSPRVNITVNRNQDNVDIVTTGEDAYSVANAVDYNGDGRQSMYLRYKDHNSNSAAMIHFDINQNGELSEGAFLQGEIGYSGTVLYETNKSQFGDFNGDGIQDISMEQSNSYYIGYHTGVNPTSLISDNNSWWADEDPFYTKKLIFSDQYPGQTKRTFYVDINGDGRSDIVRIMAGSVIKIYYSTGKLGAFIEKTINPGFAINDYNPIDFGDFNGDGNIEMIVWKYNGQVGTNSPDGLIGLVSFNMMSNTKGRYLQDIKNGFNQKTSFVYQSLAETAHGPLHGGPSAYPVRRLLGSFPVARWIISTNSLNELVQTNYEFFGAQVHMQGKGFLGFKEIRTTNTNPFALPTQGGGQPFLERKQTREEFDLNTEYFVMLPKKSQIGIPLPDGSGGLTSNNEFTYEIINRNNNRFWPQLFHSKFENAISNMIEETTYYYDVDGNITTQTRISGVLGNNLETSTTTYEDFHPFPNGWPYPSLPKEITTSTQLNNEPELEISESITYNLDGSVKDRTARSNSTDAWSKTAYTYANNLFGLVESVTVSGVTPNSINSQTGAIENTIAIAPLVTDYFTYTSDGRNIHEHTNQFGFTTSYTYFNRWGTIKKVTDHWNRNSHFEYDDFGRVSRETDYLGISTSITRSFNENYSNGAVVCSTMSDVLYKTIIYNENFNQHSVTWFNKYGQPRFQDKTEQFGVVRDFICYDSQGRTAQTSTPFYVGSDDYKVTTILYDEYDRLESSQQSPVAVSYDYLTLVDAGQRSTITSNTNGIRVAETDNLGRVFKRQDANNTNTLEYSYQSGGLLQNVKLNGNLLAENNYDSYGRQISLNDINASGITQYQYDSYDRLIYQKDNKNNSSRSYFDNLGRLDYREIQSPGMQNSLYDIEYYTSSTEENLLKKEIAPSGSSTEYFYNEQRMITSIKEQVDGESFTTNLVLDEYGRTHKKIFPGPSEFTIIYQYDNHGYLEKITDNSGALIWQIDEKNARGQITEYTLGNGIHLSHVFDPDNYFLTSSIAQNNQGALFNFEYEFNPLNGNLKHRKLGATFEYFEYDNSDLALGLHRLTGSGLSENEMNVDFTYFDNGNVMEKSGVGVYVYDPQKQNQVIKIEYDGGMDENNPNANIVDQQFVVYNHFNSASLIRNISNEHSVELIYGPDDQRKKANYFEGPEGEEEWIKSRYYIGAYEKQVDAASNEIEVHYISAGGMLVAMYVIEDGIGQYYYPHQDHLGSIIHVTDENAEIVYTQSFDAWGRTRNAEDLSYEDITECPNWLWRGYTGHEHLDEFGLINMNGRLYDPVVGRMLSPDNYVPAPSFSQGYNRYSYVLNNPLKYTDPDGEHPVLVAMAIGAGIGAIQGGMRAANNSNVSLAGGIVRGAFVGAFAGALSTVGGGPLMANVAWGAAQGALTGGLDAALWNNNIGKGMLYGAAIGAAFAAATSGLEAINNSMDGYGFGTNEGRLKFMLKNESEWSKLSGFMNDRYGINATIEHAPILDEINMGKPANERWYGAADYKNDKILLAKDAFQNRHMFKSTVVHEFAHLRLDKIYGVKLVGSFRAGTWDIVGDPTPNHKWGFDDAGNLIDGPNGWSNELRNVGRMNYNARKAFSFLNDSQFSNMKSSFTDLTGTSPFFYSVPQRFSNKVNLYGF